MLNMLTKIKIEGITDDQIWSYSFNRELNGISENETNDIDI